MRPQPRAVEGEGGEPRVARPLHVGSIGLLRYDRMLLITSKATDDYAYLMRKVLEDNGQGQSEIRQMPCLCGFAAKRNKSTATRPARALQVEHGELSDLRNVKTTIDALFAGNP